MHWILMASHFWWVLLMQGTMAGVLQVEGKRMERGVVDDGPGGLRLRPV
jgi:hypothetical protein